MTATHTEIPAPGLEFAMQIHADVGEMIQVGPAADGTRTHFTLTGGQVRGPRIDAELVSGADRFVVRADGTPFVDALYEIRTDDGALITVHNSGPAVPAAEGALPHTTLRFTAPAGPHDWLNKANFVGTIVASLEKGYVTVRVDRIV